MNDHVLGQYARTFAGASPWLRLLPGILILAVALGCGASKKPAAKVPKAPAELRELVFYLPRGNNDVANKLREHLAGYLSKAGYQIVTDQRVEHDVMGEVKVDLKQQKSLFTHRVNGQTQYVHKVHASLRLSHVGTTIDSFSSTFEVDNYQVRRADASHLARQLAKSSRLKKFVVELREEKKRRIAEAEDEALAQEAERRGDQTAWVEANPRACKGPVTLDACKGVELYLVAYPEGNHAAEAQALLEEAEPKLDELQKDDNAWKQAGAEGCKAAPSTDTCLGVEIYVQKYPAGLHQVEALQILRDAGLSE